MRPYPQIDEVILDRFEHTRGPASLQTFRQAALDDDGDHQGARVE